MTDKEIYERFMGWMGMAVSKQVTMDDGKVVVSYDDDVGDMDGRFSKQGYDDFYAGAVFDEHGAIVKAYIDSHVEYRSDNCKEIDSILYPGRLSH